MDGDVYKRQGVNKGKRECELKQIPKITSQFGLQSATRLHEAGIDVYKRQQYNVSMYVILLAQ